MTNDNTPSESNGLLPPIISVSSKLLKFKFKSSLIDSTDKLIIIYSGDSWTEIIDSYGNIVFFDLVKDGDTIRLNIKAPFEILLGNATVVDITYNKKVINTQYINPDNNVGKINIKE